MGVGAAACDRVRSNFPRTITTAGVELLQLPSLPWLRYPQLFRVIIYLFILLLCFAFWHCAQSAYSARIRKAQPFTIWMIFRVRSEYGVRNVAHQLVETHLYIDWMLLIWRKNIWRKNIWRIVAVFSFHKIARVKNLCQTNRLSWLSWNNLIFWLVMCVFGCRDVWTTRSGAAYIPALPERSVC